MKSQNQEYVKCENCKQQISVSQMYSHRLECNSQHHPQFQSSNYPQQQQKSRVQQSSSLQSEQFQGQKNISSQLQNSNQRNPNYSQNNNDSYVKCKYCKLRVPEWQLSIHRQQCNTQNHPNNSQAQSRFNQDQSQFYSSNNPQQQQKSRVQQSSLRQPAQFVESYISSSGYGSNQRNSNSLENNNASQLQRMQQQNINQYNASLLREKQKKCEYCDQEYPIEIIQEHYPICETKKLIEQMSLEDQNENIHQEQNNHHYNGQQEQYNYNNIRINEPQQRNQNEEVITKIEQLPNGMIKKITMTKNLDTGQITSQRIIISSQQQQQQQSQSQQQQINQFPTTSFGRNPFSRDHIFNIFDQLFNNNYQIMQPRIRFFYMPMMNRQHQAPQGLENLAIIKYVPYDGLSQEYKQCSICINEYQDGEELILLPCIHRFHKQCISEWFKQQSTCPICKTDITQEEMPFEEDDEQ